MERSSRTCRFTDCLNLPFLTNSFSSSSSLVLAAKCHTRRGIDWWRWVREKFRGSALPGNIALSGGRH